MGDWDDHKSATMPGDYYGNITGLSSGTLYYLQLYVMPWEHCEGDVPQQSAVISVTTLT